MMRRISLAVVLVLLVVALVVAQRQRAAAPVGGQSLLYLIADSERDLTTLPAHFTRISDADEVKYGDRLAAKLLAPAPVLDPDEARIERYLATVGTRITSKAHRRLPYRFHYLRDRSFVNAFALPGGHVFVGAGLIDKATTEDELAAVMAHEVEHIDHFHCAERLQVEAALRKIPLGEIAVIPVAVFQAGYSKEQELEADREGVLLASRGGYSANGAVRAFEMLASLYAPEEAAPRTPQHEAAQVAADVMTGYFRSHPLPPERLAQVKAMIAQQPSLAAPAETPLAVDYIFMAWRGIDAVERGEFANARDLASRALARQAGHPSALQALAQANFGLERYAEAQAVYRQLLAADSPKADAVEKWAAHRAQDLYDHSDFDRTVALVASLLSVQPGEAQLLRLAGFAHAMKGDTAAAVASGTSLQKLYPDAASQAGSDAENEATKLLGAGRYAETTAMANLAMALDAKRKSALGVRGSAEIAQAQFENAAATFRDQFDPENSGSDWLHAFAVAIGTARPQNAVAELQALLGKQETRQIPEGAMRIERAGLAVMGGSDDDAHDVIQRVKTNAIAPEQLSRLGWWYLQAHRPADAKAVLDVALTLRPGDPDVKDAIAWLALEAGKPADAITGSEAQFVDPLRQNTRAIREALAEWQQGRTADAARDWKMAVEGKPQWRNPAWRAALYPPRIAATAAALEAARQRKP